MSVQFPRVVRVFPARSLALFNRERSVRYSAGLNAVKDSVRPGDGQRIQQRSNPTFSTRRKNTLFFGINRPPRRLNKGTGAPKCL